MITSEDIKSLEKKAESKGISTQTLMQKAGDSVAEYIEKNFELKNKSILFVCYHGNNGGDGFVAAKNLMEKCEVGLMFLGEESSLKDPAKENFKNIKNEPLIQFITMEHVDFDEYDLIVDAIFGIGFKGEPLTTILVAIDAINKSKTKKISIDIPSGMIPDQSKQSGPFINADTVITFQDLKPCLEPIKDKCTIIDIGLN